MVYDISPDLSFPSTVYRGQLPKWTAVTNPEHSKHMTRSVCFDWGIAVLLE